MIRCTTSLVLSRVVPPAPYVTLTKAGSSLPSSLTVSKSSSDPRLFFGGKNSKERVGRDARKDERIAIGEILDP